MATQYTTHTVIILLLIIILLIITFSIIAVVVPIVDDGLTNAIAGNDLSRSNYIDAAIFTLTYSSTFTLTFTVTTCPPLISLLGHPYHTVLPE